MKINKSKAITDAVISTAREEEKREVALRLLKMNLPIEQIVEATELDLETIKKIESEHK
ncbi:hypothetical protein P7D85_02985 [Enterococcus hulanensis]|uniref:Transposase n=1 Tax=Enterococcus hulanensis TaxID=2559929 RepID=A0ABU3EV29_9ENTE|nr:hypothetical protein [Enterococcus hulanensis]MDT2598721.1 hypothetical protein [Enterococcus hulanensis]MDT2607775.1 hypothetical protein [Enterococcus hulanensis]MDT2615070.1 hypothetical protein [Enterococcus hulanensis]MDT2626960.1 hypothetical protein [Enterococcus hulanensis]MDT2654140.1 hypothetical protein [Enterococcus hulanensis]